MCGWDGTKTPNNRAFLSDLKDLLTNWNDIPFKKIEHAIKLYEQEAKNYDFSSNEVLCFVHCREPREIQKFVDQLDAKTLLIRRDEVDNETPSNHADANVFSMAYDYVVKNNGTLQDLDAEAVNFLTKLGYKIK